MDKTLQAETVIAASAAAIFRALTDSKELASWFAEYADISREDGRYAFWGRYTPDAPDEEQGQHPLTSWQDEREIGYTWPLRGCETQVTISLSEQGNGTLVTVKHAGLLERDAGQSSFFDFWQLTMENLRRWVAGKQAPIRHDYSTPSYGNVHLSVEIDGPREAVFDALINPATLNRHFADNATVEPYVGGRYDFGWEGMEPLKILELVPNEKLAYSWDFDEGGPSTVVTWTLQGSGGHTSLTIVHSGFGEQLTDEYSAGWLNDLSLIKSLVEFGPAWVKPAIKVAEGELSSVLSRTVCFSLQPKVL